MLTQKELKIGVLKKAEEEETVTTFCVGCSRRGWLFSVDWHDKLMGFHNFTFPVGIYGCMGTFSRYMDFISVWDSNPPTIGLRCIQHLFETKRLTFNIRMDCGTETGKLAAIHAFLCDNRDDVDDSTDLVIYGSCNNQQENGGGICMRGWRCTSNDSYMSYFKQDLMTQTVSQTEEFWHTYSFELSKK